jgi:hypothetical protein
LNYVKGPDSFGSSYIVQLIGGDRVVFQCFQAFLAVFSAADNHPRISVDRTFADLDRL